MRSRPSRFRRHPPNEQTRVSPAWATQALGLSGPGIRRRRRGGGFSYLDPEGGSVRDEDTLERIHGLAIPPAWREVWICGDPYGHIQAIGLDEAGRKQYLYHERWQLRAAQRKFESMREFAATLPRLRRAVKKDLAREGCRASVS